MLRKIRIFAATFCFVLITLLFLDFTGTIHAWFGWLAKIQFWPALLALNVGVVVGLIILTLLLGRVYCSVICPLGVLQDIISWFASKRKKYRFSYSPALKWVRYGTLVIFILACIAGIGSLVALISPYSAYGRIASNLFAPIYQEGNNLLASSQFSNIFIKMLTTDLAVNESVILCCNAKTTRNFSCSAVSENVRYAKSIFR